MIAVESESTSVTFSRASVEIPADRWAEIAALIRIRDNLRRIRENLTVDGCHGPFCWEIDS